jgi:predicted RNA binding protein YcfA (HicA-like mRNA interferase family)
MTQREKRLKRLRSHPKNVSFQELCAVLEDFGFELHNIHGSHHNFVGYVAGEKVRISLPLQHPIKPVYVKRVLATIDRIESEVDKP